MKKLLVVVMLVAFAAMMIAACSPAAEPASSADGAPPEAAAKAESAAPDAEEPAGESEQAAEEGELPVLRVAVMPSYYSACMNYISEQGWDVEEGFKMELISFTSGAPMNEALAAGLWDVAGIGTAGVYALAQYDAKLVAEIQTAAALDLMVREDSDIAAATGASADHPELLGSAETVKGKTLLCPAGTLGQYYAGKWLEELGLSLSDINFVHMELPQAYQAFQTGGGMTMPALRFTDCLLWRAGYVGF
jgi:NitT/TauT family transport system substrate-binding protein